ncbi:MAG: transcriptional regulator [Ruminococcaceae bacterium]|jgi:LCP family protein required for cell wall assembly|nr:transcriptional regulator [Oscillospiraceae bacterium]
MENEDFQDDKKVKRMEVERKLQADSDEAWKQIKAFVSDTGNWIIAGIILMLTVAGIFTVKFLNEIRAPDIPEPSGPVTIGEAPVEILGEETGTEEVEQIDDSNTEQPLVSGARKDGWYTFLLFGMDKISASTDTIMVVAYNVNDQQLNLMSIPRDTMINVSWDIKRINSVYSMNGINGLKKHVAKLIGFTPDFYVKIDLKAFVDVVNLIGGVEFDVPRVMDYDDPEQDLHIHLQPGLQTLDGEQAMGLVRWRKNNTLTAGYDDTGRVKTQQAFLKEMFKQCLKIKNWTKITGYVEIFNEDVESDLSLGNMLWFARKAMDLGEDGFYTCTIPGDYYASAWSRSTYSMQSYVTLNTREVISLINERFNPYLSNVSEANLDIMFVNSDGSISSSTGYVADGIAALPPSIPSSDETEEEDEPDTEETEGKEEQTEAGEETEPTKTETGKDSSEPTEPTEPTGGDASAAEETDTEEETGNATTTPSEQGGGE